MTGRTPAERYLAQQLASRGNWYVYVLELADGYIAVGHTASLTKRLHDHWRGLGTSWTKKHPPVKVLEVFKTTEQNANGLEEAIATQYKLTCGFQKCRGGIDNNPSSHPPPGWWIEKDLEDSDDQKIIIPT